MGIINTILSGASNTIGANPLGLAVGAGQMIAGAIQKKKAKAMLPSPEDVGERALLNTLRRRQQALATGTSAEFSKNKLSETLKTLTKNAFNAGGQVNQGMYSNLMSQTMGNIAQQTSQDIAQNLTQTGQLIKDMANRKADLTLLPRNEMLANAAQNRKAGFQNLTASFMPPDEQYQDPFGIKKKKKKSEEINTEEETEEETEG